MIFQTQKIKFLQKPQIKKRFKITFSPLLRGGENEKIHLLYGLKRKDHKSFRFNIFRKLLDNSC